MIFFSLFSDDKSGLNFALEALKQYVWKDLSWLGALQFHRKDEDK